MLKKKRAKKLARSTTSWLRCVETEVQKVRVDYEQCPVQLFSSSHHDICCFAVSAVCFFELVVDPRSFAKTIENIFHTSFLIRVRECIFLQCQHWISVGVYLLQDGLARLCLDENQLPIISPIPKKDADEMGTAASDAVRHQAIINMTMQDWQVRLHREVNTGLIT